MNFKTHIHSCICTNSCTHTHSCLQKHPYKCTRTYRTHTHSQCWSADKYVPNEDGWGQSPLAPLCLLDTSDSSGEQKKQNPDTEAWFLSHCTALCWIMLVAKALILWARFPHQQGEGVEEDWIHLGLKTQFFDKHEQWFQSLEGSRSSPSFMRHFLHLEALFPILLQWRALPASGP